MTLAEELKDSLRQEAEKDMMFVSKGTDYHTRYLAAFEDGVNTRHSDQGDWIVLEITKREFNEFPYNAITKFKGVEVVTVNKFKNRG